MNDIFKISLVLVVILGGFCLFEVVLPRQAENSIKNTVLLSDAEFTKTANSGSTYRCLMQTDKKSVSKSHSLAFAKVLMQDREFSGYGRHGSKQYRYFWRELENKPSDVVLYTSEHHIPIHVDGKDIDVGFLPVFFDQNNPFWKRQFPEEVAKLEFLQEFIPAPRSELKYVIKGLEPNQTVTVVGTLEKVGDKYRLQPFANGFDATKPHPVIVTKLSSEKLTQYLQDNYLVGNELVKMTNDGTHYEHEPQE